MENIKFVLLVLSLFWGLDLIQTQEERTSPLERILYYNPSPNQKLNFVPMKRAYDLSQHENHPHSREGRCFNFDDDFGTFPQQNFQQPSFSNIFDIDPRSNGQPLESAPIAYQLFHQTGGHLVMSPIKYLGQEDARNLPN